MSQKVIKRRKHSLPSYFRLNTPVFDPAKLQADLKNFEHLFENVLDSNRELCSNHHELALSVYDHYEQVSLTQLSAKDSQPIRIEDCAKLGLSAGVEKSLSKHQKYALKISRRMDNPALDERNYNKPIAQFIGSYLQKCTLSFRAPVTRVRLVKLKAGETVPWHIDYDPSYATRIIVPIVTNENVINSTKRRGEIESVHIPADGHPWFLNTGFSHCVENRGSRDRIVLMFSLDGQEDLFQINSGAELPFENRIDLLSQVPQF